jgi:hypothetical protein
MTMHVFLDTPFEQLRWTSQDIADAVPLRLRDFDLFDATDCRDADASANAARFQRDARLRQGYLAAAVLPGRFNVR